MATETSMEITDFKLRDEFKTGKTLTFEWRLAQIQGILRMIKEHGSVLMDAISETSHKPLTEQYLIELAAIRFEGEYIMKNLSSWMSSQRVSSIFTYPHAASYITHQPLGVVLIIGPCNYPIQLTLSPLIGAIAAAVDADETARIIEINDLDFILYSGGLLGATSVYKLAASKLLPVCLELGGKSPVFLDRMSTGKLQKAVKRILWGKCLNAGQTCIAPDYLLVVKEMEDEFIKEARNCLQQFYGDKPDKGVDYAQIIYKDNFIRLRNLISETKGKIVVGGKSFERENKLIVTPTLVQGVELSDSLMKEEIFGPVLPIIAVKDYKEAVEIITSNEQLSNPLTVYVFSNGNRKMRNEFEQRIRSGSVVYSDTLMQMSDPTLPFGGVGTSGFGRYRGFHSFKLFSNCKSIYDVGSWHEFLDRWLRYPPYSEQKLSWFRWFLGMN